MNHSICFTKKTSSIFNSVQAKKEVVACSCSETALYCTVMHVQNITNWTTYYETSLPTVTQTFRFACTIDLLVIV